MSWIFNGSKMEGLYGMLLEVRNQERRQKLHARRLLGIGGINTSGKRGRRTKQRGSWTAVQLQSDPGLLQAMGGCSEAGMTLQRWGEKSYPLYLHTTQSLGPRTGEKTWAKWLISTIPRMTLKSLYSTHLYFSIEEMTGSACHLSPCNPLSLKGLVSLYPQHSLSPISCQWFYSTRGKRTRNTY